MRKNYFSLPFLRKVSGCRGNPCQVQDGVLRNGVKNSGRGAKSVQWTFFAWGNPSEGVRVSSGHLREAEAPTEATAENSPVPTISNYPPSSVSLCPHAGRAPYFLPKRRQEIWKRNAFYRGVAIPPHDSGKRPSRNTFSHRG